MWCFLTCGLSRTEASYKDNPSRVTSPLETPLLPPGRTQNRKKILVPSEVGGPGKIPTNSCHGSSWEVGILDALASPVGCKDSLSLRQTAVSIATGNLSQGVPDDAVRFQSHRGQQVYEGNLGVGDIGYVTWPLDY